MCSIFSRLGGRSPISCRVAVMLAAFALCNLASGSNEDIYEAAEFGNLEKVKALLKEKPSMVFSNNNINGFTALHLAANKDVAELLLANHADVSAKDNYGDTPLHMAALDGHKDVVELLLANGADVNVQNKRGETPLHKAAAPRYDSRPYVRTAQPDAPFDCSETAVFAAPAACAGRTADSRRRGCLTPNLNPRTTHRCLRQARRKAARTGREPNRHGGCGGLAE
jgi:hypothetical protein